MTRSNRFHLLDALWASMNRIIAIAGKEFVYAPFTPSKSG